MSFVKLQNTSWCLEQICESNYVKLLKLIPELRSYQHTATASNSLQPKLFLRIIEKSPYTITLYLTHSFDSDQDKMELAPAVILQVYLDARLVEVMSDMDRPKVDKVYPDPMSSIQITQYKWRQNYFLQKWLDYCLLKQYQFEDECLDVI